MPAYSVREWETLPHGDGEGCIPPPLAQRLVALAKASSFAGRGGLRQLFGRGSTGGIVNMSATDHMGLDLSAFRMLEIKNGDWTLVQ